MSDSEIDYLSNYRLNHLYIHPDKLGKGAYATLLEEDERVVEEVKVTLISRLVITVFLLKEKDEISNIKLRKIQYSRGKWELRGSIDLTSFGRTKLLDFCRILSTIQYSGQSKGRIDLSNLDLASFSNFLSSANAQELLTKLTESPELTQDIFALAHKKHALEEFRKLLRSFDEFQEEYRRTYELKSTGEEAAWQNFFERNPWIFGHGMNYVFLEKASQKLESTTTGASVNSSGNRVDALMRTRAAISQYVLIEIKKPSTPLLQTKEYRSGCWAIHSQLTEAVSQSQKTTFDFVHDQF